MPSRIGSKPVALQGVTSTRRGAHATVTLLFLALKVALIAFVVGGTVAVITRGVRRSRANRLDPRWKGPGGQPGYEASVLGAMPNTPLPEWAYWGDEEDEDHGDGRAC